MIQINKSVFIKRDPAAVFAFVTDVNNSPKYQSTMQSAEWITDGPVSVGSKMKIVSRFLGKDIESTAQITDWQPPTQQSFKTIGGPIPMDMTVKVEAQDGGALLNQTGQVEMTGFFKLAEGLLRSQVEKQMEADLNALKLMMESDAA